MIDPRNYTIVVDAAGEGLPVLYNDYASTRTLSMPRYRRLDVDDSWHDESCVYVLVGPLDHDGTYEAYVGESGGVKGRMSNHNVKKDFWTRALVTCRDTTHGLSSDECKWVEAQLAARLQDAEAVTVLNGVKSLKPVPDWRRPVLQAVVDGAVVALEAFGYSVEQVLRPTTKRQRYPVSVVDLLGSGLLEAGETLHCSVGYGDKATTATVLADGSTSVEGEMYPSLSAAAVAVMDRPENGWTYWAVERGSGLVTLDQLRADFAAGDLVLAR